MVKRIAFFDFDGTITTKDTLFEFIRFSKGKVRFDLGFLFNSPWLAAMKGKIISNQAAKERILTYFFKDQPLAVFGQQCAEFTGEILPGLIRPKALAEIDRLREAGITVVIVSASPENWIQPWATRMGVGLIATRLGTITDAKGTTRLTGRINGANCHGEEKVSRIREEYTLAAGDELYAYGDSEADLPLLGLGTIRFFKPFR